mmetsp:Transcript_44395/g.110449  ORF Transcript_44395/g.110449 Transcript_44395/m.110449 type:complete len:94 (-) Transcript_44395:69-350(-)
MTASLICLSGEVTLYTVFDIPSSPCKARRKACILSEWVRIAVENAHASDFHSLAVSAQVLEQVVIMARLMQLMSIQASYYHHDSVCPRTRPLS